MAFQIESSVSCPYCGEVQVIFIDPSLSTQQYTEDCQVCCRPMIVRAQLGDDGAVSVRTAREDDVC